MILTGLRLNLYSFLRNINWVSDLNNIIIKYILGFNVNDIKGKLKKKQKNNPNFFIQIFFFYFFFQV